MATSELQPSPTSASARQPTVSLKALALFYFCLAFKPSEPHLTYYLENDKGFTDSQVNNRIYPIWTYAYFPLMVVVSVLLLSPVTPPPPLRAIIVVGTLGRLLTRFLLLYAVTLWQMQLMEIAYAMGSVAEAVFQAYVYVVTPTPAEYVRVTAVTQNAYLLSHVLSGVLGDVCLHVFGTPMVFLFYLSAVGVAAACVVAVVAFPAAPAVDSATRRRRLTSELRVLRSLVKTPAVATLVLWWVFVYTVYQLVYGYEASFYKDLQPSTSDDWNGTVLSASLLAGAVTVLIPAHPKVQRLLGTGAGNPDATAALHRVPVVVCCLAAVVAVALGAATTLQWQAALVALIVVFAAFAPLNALVMAVIARAIHHTSNDGAVVKPAASGALSVPLLDMTDSLAATDPALLPDPAPAPAVAFLTSDGAADEGVRQRAGSGRSTDTADASRGASPGAVAPALHTNDELSRPFGTVFVAITTVALAIQTVAQYGLYTAAEVSVSRSFRAFAEALAVLVVVYAAGLCAWWVRRVWRARSA